MRDLRRLLMVGLLGSLPLGACSSGDGGGNGGGAGTKYASMRSQTCLQWQDAMCDHIADKCQYMSRPECDELQTSLFCKDDASLDACMQSLSTQACQTPPTFPQNCEGLNDPLPLIAYCQEYASAVCAAQVRCNGGDQGLCEVELHFQLDPICGTQGSGIGLAPSADQCLSDLKFLTCPLTEAPESCKGVIKILQSSSAQLPAAMSTAAQQPWVDLLTSSVRAGIHAQTR